MYSKRHVDTKDKYFAAVMKKREALREKFRKEKEKENSPSGSAARFRSPWPFMNSMRFLESQLEPRPMDTNFDSGM